MPGRADALREMAAVTAILGQMPGQRPAAFWIEVAHIVCERHGITTLNGAEPRARALTKQRHAVLTLAADGLAKKQIATRLGIAENTVKSHMEHIRADLDAVNTTHAVAIALRAGQID